MRQVAAWMAVATLLIACGDTIPRTQVMLVIDAESGVRSQTTDVQIVVRGGTGAMAQWQERLDRSLTLGDGAEWPMEVSLTPLGGDASRMYEATATALSSSGDPVAVVRAVSGYRDGKTLMLRLLFEDDCRDQVAACSATQTCRAGACVDANVEVASLDPYKADVDASIEPDSGVEVDGSMPGEDSGVDAAVPEVDAGTDAGVDAAPVLGQTCDSCVSDDECGVGLGCFGDVCQPSCDTCSMTCTDANPPFCTILCGDGCYSYDSPAIREPGTRRMRGTLAPDVWVFAAACNAPAPGSMCSTGCTSTADCDEGLDCYYYAGIAYCLRENVDSCPR